MSCSRCQAGPMTSDSRPGTGRRPVRSPVPMRPPPTSGRCSARMPVHCSLRSTSPTLVLHRKAYRFMPIEHGQYLADNIEGARMVELPGSDGPLYWDHPDEALNAIEEFLTGVTPTAPIDRVLATVLYTDIVNSTRLLAEMGDARWREHPRHPRRPGRASRLRKRGPADQEHRRRHPGHLRRTGKGNPFRNRVPPTASHHRDHDPVRDPHRGGGDPGQ